MAVVYAVSEFTDEKGTDWKVKIVDGSISTGDLNHAFVLGPDGFRLNYAFDNFDRSKPIVGSKVELTLFHPDDNDAAFNALYAALDSAPEGTYRVEIYRDPDGVNEAWWIGEILPEQTIIPDAYPHAAVSITAVDGLGNLKGIDYNNDGSAYTGTNNITGHLYACFSKVHSSNFWGAGDVLCSFFEDFIGKEYKDYIAGGAQEQLENAWVDQNTFYNLDGEGTKQYFSAYDVLESIALSFNSCVFMAQGRFWFVPLGNIQGHDDSDLNISHEIRGGGVVSYNTSTNVTFAAAFGNNSADFEKLAGWERTSSPAFKEVKRERDYQGDKPILSRLDFDVGDTLTDEGAARPAGQMLLVDGRLDYFTTGITGYVGGDGYARIKLSVTLQVGDVGGTSKYLNRPVTFSDDSVMGFFNYDVQLPVYGEATWETSSASRYEIILPLFYVANGYSLTLLNSLNLYTGDLFSFITPGIPADASGLNIKFDISAINLTGVAVPAWIDTSNPVEYGMNTAGVWVYDDDTFQEFGKVDIKATNALDARYHLDQNQSLIGDRITDSDLGTITVFNGTDNVPSSQWTSAQSSTVNLSINKLCVRERLAANKYAQRIERGTLYNVGSKFLHPYSILTNSDEGVTYYQLTSLGFTASRCEYDIECMFLSRDITDITLAQDNGKPSKGDPWPTIGFESKGPSVTDDTILQANSTKLTSVSTDSGGITALKMSDGLGSENSFSFPTSLPASLKREVLLLNSSGVVSAQPGGTAGQVLTMADANVPGWADASSGGGGWFGSTALMKVMPAKFIMNDDYNRAPVMVEDDVSGKLGIKAPSSSTELYAFVAIPTGYKATHVQVYASVSTSTAVTAYSFNHTDGAIVSKGTGDFNSLIDITDINSSDTINLVIKLAPASNTTTISGADVTIAAI